MSKRLRSRPRSSNSRQPASPKKGGVAHQFGSLAAVALGRRHAAGRGEARHLDHGQIFLRVRELCRKEGGAFSDPILNLSWDSDENEPAPEEHLPAAEVEDGIRECAAFLATEVRAPAGRSGHDSRCRASPRRAACRPAQCHCSQRPRIGERPLLFGEAGCRSWMNLGLDRRRFDIVVLGRDSPRTARSQYSRGSMVTSHFSLGEGCRDLSAVREGQ